MSLCAYLWISPKIRKASCNWMDWVFECYIYNVCSCKILITPLPPILFWSVVFFANMHQSSVGHQHQRFFFPALQNFCSRRISSSNTNICWCTFVEYYTKAYFWFWKWIVIHITMLSLIHNVRGGLLEISNEVDRLMWHASSSNSPKVPTAVKACCPWRADCILYTNQGTIYTSSTLVPFSAGQELRASGLEWGSKTQKSSELFFIIIMLWLVLWWCKMLGCFPPDDFFF